MLKGILTLWVVFLFFNVKGQPKVNQDIFVDTFQSEAFLGNVEAALFDYYLQTFGKPEAYSILNELGREDRSVVEFPDSVYAQRLESIVKTTPFTATSNATLLKTINYFVKKRSRYTAVMLGRSLYYFPMFENSLANYNLPLELRYLPIVESALKPTGKSWAGAAGLWQIMYRTGRSLNLYADSYIDERYDPIKATDAACRYLSFLFNLYGDWDLALAAYNCGPGNVNKAIRRSGGKTNYWLIRPYLPKETQMYVPNFYAVMYMMTYYKEHQIIPMEANMYYHETDTVCLSASVKISHIDSIIGLSTADFNTLNPQYKTDYIPATDPPQCIVLPIALMGDFFKYQDSLYNYQNYLDTSNQNYIVLNKKKTHTVQPNESMSDIALLYETSNNDIREWNGLRNSTLFPGQRIIVMIPEKRFINTYEKSTIQATQAASAPKTTKKPSITSPSGEYKYYTLKSGENLWSISQKLGISFVDLQALNSDLNPKKMKPGQKIKIAIK
ncbi:lytic transglycosylase [Putridiphycobacter roseus]|uniref:Lytic transglycosylase n=1 Tax=Putridiphycobacter roseus TaxID=2219161 RepID=A0A2W1NBY6_9FLAO|nr:lytic transglycosylase domain-containing protein [Putridiphycobacter roseus]PZE16593.1 lytic transglycosylase [Putridiphycobacter roseus]